VQQTIYRIDHFLGKEAVQNILAVRFANGLIEPAWNREYLVSVQIDVPETLTIEGRGSFYESTGCFRDMISTHLCQVLGFVAMEPPVHLDALSLRNEKAKVFAAMRPLDRKRVVFGQYDGYRDEDDVADDSSIETFVAVETFGDTERLQGCRSICAPAKALGATRRTVTRPSGRDRWVRFGDSDYQPAPKFYLPDTAVLIARLLAAAGSPKFAAFDLQTSRRHAPAAQDWLDRELESLDVAHQSFGSQTFDGTAWCAALQRRLSPSSGPMRNQASHGSGRRGANRHPAGVELTP
jgi:glucose-6-phosphate 1-dehydrogenase